MVGTGKMKMKAFRVSTALLAVLVLLPVSLSAQEVTQQRIVTMLDNANKAAPAIDVELLRQQAAANPAGTVSSLPNWNNLARLSQMVVEINFVNNSVAMEPESYRTLGLIADALHHPNLSKYSFLVVGHTSSTGDAKSNLTLSDGRANAIKDALGTTFAVPPAHLYAVGIGQEYPIEGSDPKAASNRRVQLFNLGVLK